MHTETGRMSSFIYRQEKVSPPERKTQLRQQQSVDEMITDIKARWQFFFVKSTHSILVENQDKKQLTNRTFKTTLLRCENEKKEAITSVTRILQRKHQVKHHAITQTC